MAVTVPAGLPRVVPPSGAVISGIEIPGGVRVSYPTIFDTYLMPSADSREPKSPFRIIFRRDFRSATRFSSWSVASARVQGFRELPGCVLEMATQLPGPKLRAGMFRELRRD